MAGPSRAPMRNARGRLSEARHRGVATVTTPGGASDAKPTGGRRSLPPRAQGRMTRSSMVGQHTRCAKSWA
eukprot:9651630-Lingulodinium_polyedra.AAC.1